MFTFDLATGCNLMVCRKWIYFVCLGCYYWPHMFNLFLIVSGPVTGPIGRVMDFLYIFWYFVDSSWKSEMVILGTRIHVRGFFGQHSGENMFSTKRNQQKHIVVDCITFRIETYRKQVSMHVGYWLYRTRMIKLCKIQSRWNLIL